MSLSDYAVKRDHFEMKNGEPIFIAAVLSFPCCACDHQTQTDRQPPCATCDHNVNAIEEPPRPTAATPEQRILMEIASHAADLNPGDPIILTVQQIQVLRAQNHVYTDDYLGTPQEVYQDHLIELSSAPEDAP